MSFLYFLFLSTCKLKIGNKNQILGIVRFVTMLWYRCIEGLQQRLLSTINAFHTDTPKRKEKKKKREEYACWLKESSSHPERALVKITPMCIYTHPYTDTIPFAQTSENFAKNQSLEINDQLN